ncbi:mitochondrial fission ELM1 family protein [Rhodospirillaceae bacterium SYSU D60014]|uniref:mitochondrial fission ELM1 family protein n=1 Tax=Virgifigura deserti TaxID=2268457 RepID=UPI000E66C4E8
MKPTTDQNARHDTGCEAPRVWVLTGGKAGDNAQCVAVAQALNWPFTVKRLKYTGLYRLWNTILGASLISLDRQHSDPLAPPWPDLVIAAGRRSVPVARWIRRQAGGRTRLVQIGRPRAPYRLFDLIVTTPQYGLPERDNILHLLTPVTSPRPAEAAERLFGEAKLQPVPRPWIAVLVGGDARPYQFDPDSASRLGSAASDIAARHGGSLLVSTSRRTSTESADALAAALHVPHYFHRFGEPQNPYTAFLALADAFIVTADSASMLADVCATGRPVFLFDVPCNLDVRARGTQIAMRLLGSWRERLQDWGVCCGLRELGRMHARLLASGRLRRLEAGAADIDLSKNDLPPICSLAPVVDRVRALLAAEERERQWPGRG